MESEASGSIYENENTEAGNAYHKERLGTSRNVTPREIEPSFETDNITFASDFHESLKIGRDPNVEII